MVASASVRLLGRLRGGHAPRLLALPIPAILPRRDRLRRVPSGAAVCCFVSLVAADWATWAVAEVLVGCTALVVVALRLCRLPQNLRPEPAPAVVERNTEILRDVPRSVPVVLHPSRRGDVAGFATFFCRPNLVPFARDIARLRAVRSLTSSRSYSASEPSTPIIMRPAAVDESMPSVVEINVTPRSVKALTVSRMCSVLRPRRSNRRPPCPWPAERTRIG
jgi:hypothetical protein